MNRVLRLFMLLFTFACCPVRGLAAEPSALRVDLMIFSGRTNPSFAISDPAVLRQVVRTFAALPLHPTLTERAPAASLGYSGFHITPTGMDGVAWFEVYGNTVEVASSATVAGTQARSFRFDKESALERLLFQAARVQGVRPFGPETPTPPSMVGGAPLAERSVTINVGVASGPFWGTPIRPPVTVQVGTRVKLAATQAAENATNVRWIRDSRELPDTGGGRTLEIASASPADSGLYWALVGLGGDQSMTSAQAELLVTAREGPRLLNLSVLSRIGAEQRVLTSGFTIEAGALNSRTLVLVRAVGPALASLGVDGPLRAPQLRVMNSSGAAVAPANVPFSLPTVAAATERVGAFALPANSADVALLYYLPAGAFTAHVSSADASTGSVLLEVYEVPLN